MTSIEAIARTHYPGTSQSSRSVALTKRIAALGTGMFAGKFEFCDHSIKLRNATSYVTRNEFIYQNNIPI